MAELHPDLAQYLSRCAFDPDAKSITVGVSGGADSAALLLLARASGLEVDVIHVDHGLRPDSAEEFVPVAALAADVGATARSVQVHLDDGPDLEARARTARHQVLGPDAAWGHTADDQAETVLMRLIRGSGPQGLGAMVAGPRHPILALRRVDTEAICALCRYRWVEDPSNADRRFTRNRVRHEVMPLLADVFSRDPVPPINRAARLVGAASAEVDALAADLDPTDCRALNQVSAVVAAAALRRWLSADGYPPSAAEVDRLLAIVAGETRATQLSGGRRVHRRQNRLRLDQTDR